MKLFKNLDFDKLKNSLNKTRDKLVTKITETVSGKAQLDEELLEELEEALITSDIGTETSLGIIEKTRIAVKKETNRDKLTVIETGLSCPWPASVTGGVILFASGTTSVLAAQPKPLNPWTFSVPGM